MNSSDRKPVLVNLNIGDQLTSTSCGHVVVELIKFIVYQRLQIPYSYQWLKQVINKKKESINLDQKESFQSERHFHVASTALANLDFTLKSILQEISGSSIPLEVCIALGATPVTCKEVYRLLLPTICHKPQCHSSLIATDQKIQRNIFRSLVTSEELNQVFFNSIPPTNMYVFLRKKTLDNQDAILSTSNFTFTDGCRIPRSSKIVVIDFRTDKPASVSCCNDFQIFGDLESTKCNEINLDIDYNEIESTDDMKWYQSSYVMKGFKDCIVNGSSVTNQWLDS
ncbi:hypothetical protein O3G_MSEX006353 [Manduca sexta]|uniref:MAD2L1-binding protein n=1 Tax=Manduca sexta TaxID=7130 RepID=A0A922CKT6_MANSE|nr:hypothetical protein O3G_MSEX006353 [Manduca sexta]